MIVPGEDCEDVQDVATIFNLRMIKVLPVDAEQLSKETRKYSELSKVIPYLHKDMAKEGDTSFIALS